MLGKIFQAISDFFASLFGGKPSEPPADEKPTSPTTGRPTEPSRPAEPSQPTSPTTPAPAEAEEEEADPLLAQDGSEIQPDTVVVVASEKEQIRIIEEEEGDDTDDDEDESTADGETVVEEPATPPTTPAVPPADRPQGRYLWCLDNGHGKLTKGKRSPVLPSGERLFEYEFNRDIVRRIIEKIEPLGVQYYNVVPEVDTDNFLAGRVERANNKKSVLPKIFVSIHANAGPARSMNDYTLDSISGIETWYYYGSKKGQKIASVFQRHIVAFTGMRNRHLKTQKTKQFYVLRKTNMPAILTENGFYNNREEAIQLMTDEVRQRIADAHVAAILEIEKNGI